jgi:hypothetical protein
VQVHPHPAGLQHQLNPDHTNPTLRPGGLSNRDSPIPSWPFLDGELLPKSEIMEYVGSSLTDGDIDKFLKFGIENGMLHCSG